MRPDSPPPVELERTFLGPEPDDAPRDAPDEHGYLEAAPPADLRPWVARLYLCDERVAPGTTIVERVLPDGSLIVQLNLGDVPVSHPVDAQAIPVGHAAEALGARASASIVRLSGSLEGAGIQLRPGNAAALLGVPAGELAGASVPLDVLWGAAFAREAVERLAAVPHGPARAAVLATLARERLAHARRRAGRPSHLGAAAATHALALVRQSAGRTTVRALADALGIGERRLEQLFHRHVGLSPKVTCRLARFRAALRLARRAPAVAWTDVAYRGGYADQSHLVHEFRAIAGMTPERFMAVLG